MHSLVSGLQWAGTSNEKALAKNPVCTSLLLASMARWRAWRALATLHYACLRCRADTQKTMCEGSTMCRAYEEQTEGCGSHLRAQIITLEKDGPVLRREGCLFCLKQALKLCRLSDPEVNGGGKNCRTKHRRAYVECIEGVVHKIALPGNNIGQAGRHLNDKLRKHAYRVSIALRKNLCDRVSSTALLHVRLCASR